MQAPGFWYPARGRGGLRSLALAPLGMLYGLGVRWRLRRGRRHAAAVPVLCIGNLNAGGTGKTPAVIALAELLAARGLAPAIVSRGYGGRLKGPVRVEPGVHGAADTGDEPLLMAAFAPVWVARDRAAGVKAAEAGGAEAILLDDGHQNADVRKDLSIVVADARRGFGNGRMIPAGPLREPPARGLARADALLTIGGPEAQAAFDARHRFEGRLARLRGRLEPLATGMPWKGLPVLAFAGIGDPEKFFATLRTLGADLRRAEALGDHQPLTPALMRRLEAEARETGAQMVTTEKDAVRLPADFRQKVLTLPVRLRFDDQPALEALIDAALARRSAP